MAGRQEWLTVEDIGHLLFVVSAKVVVGGGGGGTMMVAGGDGLGFFFFFFWIYFRKLNNKRLKIRFELKWCTYGDFLLVEHRVEQKI